MVGKITTDPATIETVGPESSVDRATEATTEPISIAGAKGTVTDLVGVGFIDPALRLKGSQVTGAVRVEVQVIRAQTLTSRPRSCLELDGVPRRRRRAPPLDAHTVRRLGAALIRALPGGSGVPQLLVGPRHAGIGRMDRESRARARRGRRGRNRRERRASCRLPPSRI